MEQQASYMQTKLPQVTPNLSTRQKPRFSVLEPLVRRIVCAIARAVYKPVFHGFDKLPETGAGMIICNHVSYMDGVIIAAGSKRPIRFVIDGEIYNAPFVHSIMKLGRAIPILPTRESVVAAFEEVSVGLKAGDLICIFPEGQLTYTGSLSRFRPGIESIIKRDPVPVYPIVVTGLWGSIFSRKYLKSRLRWWPRHWGLKITAICGDPIPPEEVKINHLQEIILRLKYSVR